MTGEVIYLYAFDVASEIITARIGETLGRFPREVRIRTDHTYPRDVPLYQPLAIEPDCTSTLRGRKVRVVVSIYDVGVISIAAHRTFEVRDLSELSAYHAPRLDDGAGLDQLARELCDDVCRGLATALVDGSPPSEPEAYTVFHLSDIDGRQDVQAWLAAHRREVAGLLAETEPERLSDEQVQEGLRVERSFSKSDVLVIDWDAALLVDLDGYVDDVLYVLELANMQLEEYRRMDQRLDRYLNRAYEDVQRRRFSMIGTHTRILRKLRLFRVDVTRLNDEVSHIGKFFGDWFLARVYLGASERFYLDHWRKSVEQRLDQLDKLYTVVSSEITNQRLLLLELMIVIFFAIDLVMLYLK